MGGLWTLRPKREQHYLLRSMLILGVSFGGCRFGARFRLRLNTTTAVLVAAVVLVVLVVVVVVIVIVGVMAAAVVLAMVVAASFLCLPFSKLAIVGAAYHLLAGVQ